jgi:hypothetical protein
MTAWPWNLPPSSRAIKASSTTARDERIVTLVFWTPDSDIAYQLVVHPRTCFWEPLQYLAQHALATFLSFCLFRTNFKIPNTFILQPFPGKESHLFV